ncbi:hypothetical protein F8M41_013835 [Gigaspora margarita]|uniref:Uncharacterized protein n=1 Tax=Gigaspora margarita TaxID=4874 RepID=A0A8H4AS25_GIGMA|nr:hypothetical protein F8M41_013835 [Gigaspora margarita]
MSQNPTKEYKIFMVVKAVNLQNFIIPPGNFRIDFYFSGPNFRLQKFSQTLLIPVNIIKGFTKRFIIFIIIVWIPCNRIPPLLQMAILASYFVFVSWFNYILLLLPFRNIGPSECNVSRDA